MNKSYIYISHFGKTQIALILSNNTCEVTNLMHWLYFSPKINIQPLKYKMFSMFHLKLSGVALVVCLLLFGLHKRT